MTCWTQTSFPAGVFSGIAFGFEKVREGANQDARPVSCIPPTGIDTPVPRQNCSSA